MSYPRSKQSERLVCELYCCYPMNVFRLVLCLAGLAAYLVAKQWLHFSPSPASPAGANPSTMPASNVRQTASCPLPAVPSTGVLKSEHSLADVRK